MEMPKHQMLTRLLRAEPVKDSGAPLARKSRALGIGITVLAVKQLILTIVEGSFRLLLTAFVFNRIQSFFDGVMIDARSDSHGSRAAVFKRRLVGIFDVQKLVCHEARENLVISCLIIYRPWINPVLK